MDAAIGGPTGHLLEHNAQVIGQIRANLAACKVYLLVNPLQPGQLLQRRLYNLQRAMPTGVYVEWEKTG
jgi:hypothetical protein